MGPAVGSTNPASKEALLAPLRDPRFVISNISVARVGESTTDTGPRVRSGMLMESLLKGVELPAGKSGGVPCQELCSPDVSLSGPVFGPCAGQHVDTTKEAASLQRRWRLYWIAATASMNGSAASSGAPQCWRRPNKARVDRARLPHIISRSRSPGWAEVEVVGTD